MKKTVLYLMTYKGFAVLQNIILTKKELISWVVVAGDSALINDFKKEIIELCETNNINWFTKNNAPNVDDKDYILAISWRWIIHHPTNRLVVIHDSLLPKYRGFSPLVNMLINGETEIGATAILGSESVDSGPIISQKSYKIEYPIKIMDAINVVTEAYKILCMDTLTKISQQGEISAREQIEQEATYSIWRDESDYQIDWRWSSTKIARFVDAVGYPYSFAKTYCENGDKVIIKAAEVEKDVNCEIRQAGKVLFVQDGFPTIICGQGLIKIKEAFLDKNGKLTGFLPIARFRTKFVNPK